jgi:hypothetical protein
MSAAVQFPYPGIKVGRGLHGATILRLHYEADPKKSNGPRTFVPELSMELSPWALGEWRGNPETGKTGMTDPTLFRQELEIDGSATLGQLLYLLNEEATIEKAFDIPPDWTRYFALDPHPAVPHAALWGACDPWGDLWIYRELWPSRIYGKVGNTPEDDNRYTVREFVQAVKWLESEENNHYRSEPFSEQFYKRVIDYAARAFGKGTTDDPEQPNYQQRFEATMLELELDSPTFEDAKKDHDVGIECVNEWLKVREVDDGRTGWAKKSRMHIFGDRCPELIYQLKNNRRRQLTPIQAEMQDPTGAPILKRNHLTDDLRYMCMAQPEYVASARRANTWQPAVAGIAY